MVARQPERLFQSGEYFPCLIGKGNMLVAIRQPCDEGFLPPDAGFRLSDMSASLRHRIFRAFDCRLR